MALTERRAAILRLIIGDYVQTAQPIGSEALVQRHKIERSSATIRNEMALLEEDGYIHLPHTSAGRVPSDKGYRYFVETLIGEPDLPSEEKLRILHQFHQATSEMAEWLHLAASVLSQSVRNLAVVTAPPRLTMPSVGSGLRPGAPEPSGADQAISPDLRSTATKAPWGGGVQNPPSAVMNSSRLSA